MNVSRGEDLASVSVCCDVMRGLEEPNVAGPMDWGFHVSRLKLPQLG